MTQTYRSFPYGSFIPKYAQGLRLSYATTTTFAVATGSILDSTETWQLSLSTAQTVTATTSGLNGLDTGTFAASTVYAVYLVADPITQQPTGCIMSTSTSGPLMPFGYSAYALIGYITTDASTHFLKGYWTGGNTGRRTFMYDAPQATAVTAGSATSYTAVNLSAWIPVTSAKLVWINTAFTPGAASRTLKMQPVSGTGDAIVITGQVTSVVVTTQSMLFCDVATGMSEINYVVSNAGDAVAINVAGYEFFI